MQEEIKMLKEKIYNEVAIKKENVIYNPDSHILVKRNFEEQYF